MADVQGIERPGQHGAIGPAVGRDCTIRSDEDAVEHARDEEVNGVAGTADLYALGRRQRQDSLERNGGGFRKGAHDQQAGQGVLAFPVTEALRKLQAVGHHAVRRTPGYVDAVRAALDAIGGNGGRAADTDDGSVRVCQFDGAKVGPARHRFGCLDRCDLARPLVEEVCKRSFGIGYERLQYGP